MKVAISMGSLHERFLRGELNNVSFVKYAASLCVDGVELSDKYLPPDSQELAEIRRVLEETGLEVACYALTSDLWEGDALRQAIATGLTLDANCISLPGGEATPEVVQGLNKVLPYIQEAGLTLCLEGGMPQGVAELIDRLDSPYIKSTFEMANYLLAGERPNSKIGLVRATDLRLASPHEEAQSVLGFDGQHYVGSVLGLGLVQVQSLMQILQEQDYTGWIAVDFAGLENPLFGIEASLKNLRQYLREL